MRAALGLLWVAEWLGWGANDVAPTLFIAIGGGGFIPARILRTFLKTTSEGKKQNIPIQAVGLTLYESLGGVSLAVLWSGSRGV